MIDSEAKISVDKTDEGHVIVIYPQLKSWQTIALRIWVAVWSVTGLLGIMGMIKESSGNQWAYFIIFIMLWGYFLYYAIRSIVWHQSGKEYVRITAETLDYKRSWGTYGKAVSYDLETIKKMELVNLDDKAFAKAYQDAFWTVGGEKIVFDYIGKKVVFGLRLTEKDAKTVMKMIKKKGR